MKKRHKLYIFTVRWFYLWVFGITGLNAQNPENMREEIFSLLRITHPSIIINRTIDNPQIILIDSSKNISINLIFASDKAIDAGLHLFPEKMSAYYDSRILRFIEREMLLIYLKKGRVIPYEYVSYKINGKSADPQKVFEKINKGSFINLTSMQMKTDVRENRKLFTAELSFGKEKFEMSFPARVDLVLGASWENLSNELISTLKNASPSFELNPPYQNQKETPIISKQPAHREGLWEDVIDTAFSSGDSKLYYSMDSSGYSLVTADTEPVEHLNNVLIISDTALLKNIKLRLKIKKYGALFDEISTGISEILTLLQNRGSVYLAFEEHNGRKLVDLFFPDKELNFFHLLYFEVDNFSLAALQNKELKGWLYPYLRLDNLKEIDKEFDDNAKPKWKVPIGQK